MENKYLIKINRLIQRNLSTFALHQQTFLQFRNKHLGEDIVILASGVTASTYKKPLNALHIGVNRSFQLGIPLDYMFIQDYSGATPQYIDELNEYRKDKCIKFYGLTNEFEYDPDRTIPDFQVIKANALRYRTDWDEICWDGGFTNEFAYDLSVQPLGCFGSVVFPALQFALWTHPKRIFLVGCDCTNNGYAYNKNSKNFLCVDKILKAYGKFKDFAHKYYPDIDIISINPVGLKGIFKDIEM